MDLVREIRDEPRAEKVLRALSGTRLRVRETRLGVKDAARWLHGHGYPRDAVIATLTALAGLYALVVFGDGWQLLADVEDGNFFLLATLEEAPK